MESFENIPSLLLSLATSSDDSDPKRKDKADDRDASTHTTEASSPGGSPGTLERWSARPELYTSATESSDEQDRIIHLVESVPNLMQLPDMDAGRSVATAPVSIEQANHFANSQDGDMNLDDVDDPSHISESSGGGPGDLGGLLAHPDWHTSFSYSNSEQSPSSIPGVHPTPNVDEMAGQIDELSVVTTPTTPEKQARPITGAENASFDERDNHTNTKATLAKATLAILTDTDSHSTLPESIAPPHSVPSYTSDFSSVEWSDRMGNKKLVEELDNDEAERRSTVPPTEESEGQLSSEPDPLALPADFSNLLINVNHVGDVESVSGFGDLSSVGIPITKEVAKDVFSQQVVPLEIPVADKNEDVSTLCGGRYDDASEYDDYPSARELEEVVLGGDIEQGKSQFRILSHEAPSTASWFGGYFSNISRLEIIFLVLIGISAAVLVVLIVALI